MKAILQKIWKYPKGKLALSIFSCFIFIAIFADFLANDKPIYCKYEGKYYFPIFHEYGNQLGMTSPYPFAKNKSWSDIQLESAIYPLVRFSANSIEKYYKYYQSPGTKITNGSLSKRYGLGSDSIGRDVAAGLISGTRLALIISFLAVLIALLIGASLAILSGYFGDHFFELNIYLLISFVLLIGFMFFQFMFGHMGLLTLIFLFVLTIVVLVFAQKHIKGRSVYIPFDIIVMRMIEIFKSIPALFVLLALLPLISKPSLFYVIIIIGILRWPTIARLLRAEFMRIKAQDYVLASKSLGMSHWQILKHHIIPNSLPPLVTILAFGLGGTILLEATLSFLGIGLSAETVTWGSLLSDARGNFRAWWLAIFPGAAIYLMVIACNYIGEVSSTINKGS